MDFKKIKSTPIEEKKEFSFEGDHLIQKECVDKEKRIYVYERYNHSGRLYGYEVVKGVRRKNPDGEIVYTYPSSEQFGRYGYFISAQFKDSIPAYVKTLQEMGQKS